MTLVEAFLNTCKKHAQKTAVIDQNSAVTYNDLRVEAIGKAARLLSENTGSHIGILLPNCKEFVTTFYGILMAGKIPVPLNYLLSPTQLLYVIQNAGIDTVFTNNLFKPQIGTHIRHVLSVEEESSCAGVEEKKIKPGNEEELAALLYIGYQCQSQGVMLSHRNFLSNLEGCVRAFEFTERIHCLASFHSFIPMH